MTLAIQDHARKRRWRADAAWRNLQRLWAALQSLLTYLAVLAMLANGLVLIIKRRFSEAALKYMADASSLFRQIREQAYSVVETWDAIFVEPILSVLQQFAWFTVPVAALEVLTLALFALGPVARATWASRAVEAAIQERFMRREELLGALARQESEIKKDREAREELQKALETKGWKRVKSAFAMVTSLASTALSILNAPQAGRDIYVAWIKWKEVVLTIHRLGQQIDAKAAAIRQAGQLIAALEAEDKGLLARIGDAERDVVDREVRLYVARKMRLTIELSRMSLFFVGAVYAAFAVDWLWAR